MAKAGTLHDAFIDELRDTYDAERQLTKALAKLAKAADTRPVASKLRNGCLAPAVTITAQRPKVRLISQAVKDDVLLKSPLFSRFQPC